jgi:hypothetical protein
VIFTLSSWLLGNGDIRQQADASHSVILQWLLHDPRNHPNWPRC